jgi:uncharacterized protein YciI
MKSSKSLLENQQIKNSGYFVRHTNFGMYLGKPESKNHWYMHSCVADAMRFETAEEAEAFISQRPYWLQEWLEVVYIRSTQSQERLQVFKTFKP